MIGSSIENSETPLQAAIRVRHEELGKNDDLTLLSNTLKNEVILFCLEHGFIFENIEEDKKTVK